MTYSAWVRILTVLLPLLALALLSTLFLVARTPDGEATLPYVEAWQARSAGAGDGMQRAFFTGNTEAGDAVTVQADRVTMDPEQSDHARAELLRTDIRYTDGSHLRIVADSGDFQNNAEQVRLEGNVVVESSTGYDLFAQVLLADLSVGEAQSEGAIHAVGPAGTIDAGQLFIQRQADNQIDLVFTNRVKLIYRPPQEAE